MSAHNLCTDPEDYIKTPSGDAIREFYLAGHSRNEVAGMSVLIDDHASCVCAEVWERVRLRIQRPLFALGRPRRSPAGEALTFPPNGRLLPELNRCPVGPERPIMSFQNARPGAARSRSSHDDRPL